jgi:hypothetical protein
MISVSRNGTELGEWSEDQIRNLYKEGQLLPTDHYWKEGMTEWAELSKMIKPPPPAAKIPVAVNSNPPKTQRINPENIPTSTETSPLPQTPPQFVDVRAFEEKKPWSVWLPVICFIIGSSVVIGLKEAAHGDFLTVIISLLFLSLLGAIIYCMIHLFDRYPKILIPFWSCVVLGFVALIVLVYARYGNIDFLTEDMQRQSNDLNKSLPRMADSITRIDGTSVTANHTFQYRYTLMTDEPISADNIRQYMLSSLKADYAAHPELQAFRDKGVTFEYDYFNKGGTPITQIVVGPNDLK